MLYSFFYVVCSHRLILPMGELNALHFAQPLDIESSLFTHSPVPYINKHLGGCLLIDLEKKYEVSFRMHCLN